MADDVELGARLVERHLRFDTTRQELHRRYEDGQKLMGRHSKYGDRANLQECQ